MCPYCRRVDEFKISKAVIEKQIDPVNAQAMLHNAIINDSAEEINQSVQIGANINQGKDGKSSLMWATLLRKPSAVKTLLELGAEADEKLVQYAIQLFDIKSAALMAIQSGCINSGFKSANMREFNGNNRINSTLLAHAIIQGDFESAIFLLKNNASIGCVNDQYIGNKIISCIIKHFTNTDSDSDTLILEMCHELLNSGYQPDGIWSYAQDIRWPEDNEANIFYKEKLLKFFLNNGANPNYFRRQYSPYEEWKSLPIFQAIYYGNKQSVKILLDAGADVNAQVPSANSRYPVSSPIKFAIDQGKPDIVEILLEYGANF